jgi:hypothetical protein
VLGLVSKHPDADIFDEDIRLYDVTKEVLVGSFSESEDSWSDQKHDCQLQHLKNYRYHKNTLSIMICLRERCIQ